MRILVAGSTGALGKQLVPRLVGAGHEVTGMTRTASKKDAIRATFAKRDRELRRLLAVLESEVQRGRFAPGKLRPQLVVDQFR